MGRVAKLMVVNALGAIAFLALLEIGARLLLPPHAGTLFSDPGLGLRKRPFVQPHPVRGFALRPGSYARDEGPIEIDARGFRGAALPEDLARRETLAAFGDSTTFGWKLGQGSDYPSQLAELLGGEGPIVLNAGVPSYTSAQIRLYVDELLDDPSLDLDLVLVSSLWNDLWFSGILNWYPELLVAQQPPAWLSALVRHSRLVRALLLPDRSHAASSDVFNPRALELFVDNLAAIADRCDAAGVPLVFVAAPFDGDHVPEAGFQQITVRFSKPFLIELARRYDAATQELARRRGVPFLDHGISLREPRQPDLFADPIHANAAGNAVLARDVLADLRELGLVAPPSRAGN